MKASKVSRNDRIPLIMALSDFFKCQNANCVYHTSPVRMRVRGNTARCSQCGSTMYRI